MKTREAILADFIRDYNLEIPGRGVCFSADIEFTTVSFFEKFTCEVHIITMLQTQLSLVYLLQPQLAELGIPDVFPFDAQNFSYKKNQPLLIKDHDLLRGSYTLSIAPKDALSTAVDKNIKTQKLKAG